MTHYGYKYNYTHNTFLKSHVIFLNVFFATQYVFVHKKTSYICWAPRAVLFHHQHETRFVACFVCTLHHIQSFELLQ